MTCARASLPTSYFNKDAVPAAYGCSLMALQSRLEQPKLTAHAAKRAEDRARVKISDTKRAPPQARPTPTDGLTQKHTIEYMYALLVSLVSKAPSQGPTGSGGGDSPHGGRVGPTSLECGEASMT